MIAVSFQMAEMSQMSYVLMFVLQVQIGILASNSNEVNIAIFKLSCLWLQSETVGILLPHLMQPFLSAQILRLNGLTLAALGQAQVLEVYQRE